ncbi:hypothetical protein [Methylocystis bryophila]|nr:hypothetical protein [Methylocystis bryophila]
MEKVLIIGLDVAKRSFQVHGALVEGGVAFAKKFSRVKSVWKLEVLGSSP